MAAEQPSIPTESKAASSADSLAELATSEAIDPKKSEDLTVAWLQQPDLRASEIEQLSKAGSAMKSRKVRLAIVVHNRTPRHITLPLLRQLFTFDLMGVALAPTVPADIKHAAEDVLIQRSENISTGERLTLARRASGRVAGHFLLDGDSRVMRAALDNLRLTESSVAKAICSPAATPTFVDAVCSHGKWSLRQEIRIALLGCEKTSLARILAYARELPTSLVQDIVRASKLPDGTKRYLQAELEIPD